MARLVSKRVIKGKPKKRASTVAQRLRNKSPDELIRLLAIYPNTKIAPIIKRYLQFRGISDEEINRKINKIREKREIKQDLTDVYYGLKTEEEVAKKYPNKEFVKSPGVRQTSKYYNKFEIPSGMKAGHHVSEIEHIGKVRTGGESKPRMVTVQRLLLENPVIWSMYQRKKRRLMETGQGREEFVEWLFQLARDRPEFAANIAYILYSDDEDKESKKTLGKNSALRYEMENALTERAMLQYKRNPFKVPLKQFRETEMIPKKKKKATGMESEDGVFSKETMDEDLDEKDESSMTKFQGEIKPYLPVPGTRAINPKTKKLYTVVDNYYGKKFDDLRFGEKPEFRKKKAKSKKPVRRKVRKTVRSKKPVKRKCRCK